MWPDRVSNPGPLALESDALQTALRGPTKGSFQCSVTDISYNSVIATHSMTTIAVNPLYSSTHYNSKILYNTILICIDILFKKCSCT